MVAPTSEQIKKADASLKRKAANRKAAAKMSAKDEAVKPAAPDFTPKPGEQVPLHILNLQARKLDRAAKDKALTAANAARKAVHEVLKPNPAAPRQAKAKVEGPQTGALASAEAVNQARRKPPASAMGG